MVAPPRMPGRNSTQSGAPSCTASTSPVTESANIDAQRYQHPLLAEPVDQPGDLRRAQRRAERPGRRHAAGRARNGRFARRSAAPCRARHGHRHPADDPGRGEPPRAPVTEDLRVRQQEPPLNPSPPSARHRVPCLPKPDDTGHRHQASLSFFRQSAGYQRAPGPWLDRDTCRPMTRSCCCRSAAPRAPTTCCRSSRTSRAAVACPRSGWPRWRSTTTRRAGSARSTASAGTCSPRSRPRAWTCPSTGGTGTGTRCSTDTVRRMAADGVRRAIAFVTSAYSSYSACRQYRDDIEAAVAAAGASHARRGSTRSARTSTTRGSSSRSRRTPKRRCAPCRRTSPTVPGWCSPRTACRSAWPPPAAARRRGPWFQAAGTWPS